uniref:Pre-mRNA-splicing factor SPF27 n=1 Tax=Setaria digitata TaxID=48799 RepID=A0A915Q0V9_9BILA
METTSMAVVSHGTAVANKSEDAAVLVDALPYLDSDYTESDRQMAMQLIEDECRIFRPMKNYLQNMSPPDFDVFLTPCLIKEHIRMSKKQEMPKLDMSRYELSCPSTTGRQGDKTSWRKATAQNEHLLLRNINLQLMDEHAPPVYLRYNKDLETVLHCEERELRKLREEVMEIHSRRRKSQMEAGLKLKDLEQNWVQMVTKNYKMELACQELAADNEVLAKKAKLMS